MKITLLCRAGWLLGNALAACAALTAETVAEKNAPGAPVEPTPIPGIFNTELPRLLRPESLRLSVRPHFGDFVNHDHLRFTLGLRYGLTPQWELNGDVDSYVSHGLGDVPAAKEMGFSKVRLGVKYKFSEFLLPYWETAVGLKYSFPVGNPPSDFTDGSQHITPYMTHAHRWESRPEFTTFFSYGVDFVSSSSVSGTLDDGAIDTNNWFVTPGVVWHRGAFDYSLEATLASSLGVDSNETYRVTLRPGVKWTLPPRLTFRSRSRWIVGVSVHGGYGTTGTSFGSSLRLQTNFDFKRLFKRRAHSDEVAPNAPAVQDTKQ